MSLGPDNGDVSRYPGLLASREDREATQAVLETAFADERLTQDEFESRVGRAMSARTLADLAELTRDLPAAPARRAATRRSTRWVWPAAAGAVVVALAAFGITQLVTHGSSHSPRSSSSAAPQAGTVPGSSAAQPTPVAPATAASGGSAQCPAGTSDTARTIADALTLDPVYVDPASSRVSETQARRIRAKIARRNPGRIRVAAVTSAALRRGGGARALANAIASCPADSAGTVLVATPSTAWVVTSYANPTGAAQAVQAALNTHASLAAGLLDAVGRLALVDSGE
ncbi:MAG: DUF1707 domain-containing protein [Actinomycetota bacterium]